jgi:hypothetical protein
MSSLSFSLRNKITWSRRYLNLNDNRFVDCFLIGIASEDFGRALDMIVLGHSANRIEIPFDNCIEKMAGENIPVPELGLSIPVSGCSCVDRPGLSGLAG